MSGSMNLARPRIQAKAPAGGVAKKLVIKPLKLKPQLPADFEEVTRAKLCKAVHAVQAKTTVSCSLEELYRAVEDMCLHKMAAKLYGMLEHECDVHIGRELAQLSSKATLDPAAFLEHIGRCWDDHCSQMLLIRSIFLYLDRTYVLANPNVRSLFDMGLHLFRTHLHAHPEVRGFFIVFGDLLGRDRDCCMMSRGRTTRYSLAVLSRRLRRRPWRGC